MRQSSLQWLAFYLLLGHQPSTTLCYVVPPRNHRPQRTTASKTGFSIHTILAQHRPLVDDGSSADHDGQRDVSIMSKSLDSHNGLPVLSAATANAFLQPLLLPLLLLLMMMIYATTAAALPASAMDHPAVDHVLLGIPIPVPDARYFLAGGLCAAASHGATTPIDVVKTRMQAEPLKYNEGVVRAAQIMWDESSSGYATFLAGLGPTVLGYGVEGAAKFGLYESLKPTFASIPLLTHGGSSSTAIPYLLASVSAGAVASLMLCPLERVRIRSVTDPNFPNSLPEGLSRLIEEEGPLAIFGGIGAMLFKQVPYTICKQVSFDVFAGMLYSAAAALSLSHVQVEITIGAAFLASILACVASHPGDVILTDTYKSAQGGQQLSNFTRVVADIYQQDGLEGFLAGLSARFLHVGSIITSQLVIYDSIKQLLGLPATGT